MENLHVIHEGASNVQKLTVWCALWLDGVIEVTLFENVKVQTEIVISKILLWNMYGINKTAQLATIHVQG